MLIRMFPPFPIPGFAPNFTGYDWHEQGIDWYEMYQMTSQQPLAAMFWVTMSTTQGRILLVGGPGPTLRMDHH